MSKLTLVPASEITGRIATLATSAHAIQAEIHLLACSTLAHVQQHGDTRGMLQLLNALPNGQRVKSLAHWFRLMSSGKCAPKVNKETKLYEVELSKNRTPEDFKIDEACETSFADLTVEREPVSVTIESIVRNLTRTSENDTVMENGAPKVEPKAREFAAKLVKLIQENKLIAA